MLHQGHGGRLKKAVFRVFDSTEISKKTDQTNPKGATKKQQRKNNKEKTSRKGLKGKKEYLRGEVFSALYMTRYTKPLAARYRLCAVWGW